MSSNKKKVLKIIVLGDTRYVPFQAAHFLPALVRLPLFASTSTRSSPTSTRPPSAPISSPRTFPSTTPRSASRYFHVRTRHDVGLGYRRPGEIPEPRLRLLPWRRCLHPHLRPHKCQSIRSVPLSIRRPSRTSRSGRTSSWCLPTPATPSTSPSPSSATSAICPSLSVPYVLPRSVIA